MNKIWNSFFLKKKHPERHTFELHEIWSVVKKNSTNNLYVLIQHVLVLALDALSKYVITNSCKWQRSARSSTICDFICFISFCICFTASQSCFKVGVMSSASISAKEFFKNCFPFWDLQCCLRKLIYNFDLFLFFHLFFFPVPTSKWNITWVFYVLHSFKKKNSQKSLQG